MKRPDRQKVHFCSDPLFVYPIPMSVVHVELPENYHEAEEKRRARFRECYQKKLSITDYLSEEERKFVEDNMLL